MTLTPTTAHVIDQFNLAFQTHDPILLDGLIDETCVMESVEPAPNGTRYEGGSECLAFWRALASDRAASFHPEDVAVIGDRAIIQWRYSFGPEADDSVRGVNVMTVTDGKITEALGYVKSGDAAMADAIHAATTD